MLFTLYNETDVAVIKRISVGLHLYVAGFATTFLPRSVV